MAKLPLAISRRGFCPLLWREAPAARVPVNLGLYD
jgi:hypothetical protein